MGSPERDDCCREEIGRSAGEGGAATVNGSEGRGPLRVVEAGPGVRRRDCAVTAGEEKGSGAKSEDVLAWRAWASSMRTSETPGKELMLREGGPAAVSSGTSEGG
ncbi:hypothetical protein MLD38_035442 [Melastoma candidum]|uniref:Uncharacterized protein n=1 Tax=Melastoma candidum TaxID=119954 RepID=A0ACB9LGN9_9MYRT|nr:hypothetical protein MLD38_035442 [Melastoma candidum]